MHSTANIQEFLKKCITFSWVNWLKNRSNIHIWRTLYNYAVLPSVQDHETESLLSLLLTVFPIVFLVIEHLLFFAVPNRRNYSTVRRSMKVISTREITTFTIMPYRLVSKTMTSIMSAGKIPSMMCFKSMTIQVCISLTGAPLAWAQLFWLNP